MEKSKFIFLNEKDNYDKYLEDLKKYYNLKKKYNNQKEIIKKNIFNNNPNMSIELKKKLYNQNKFKCVNCKLEGGNVFIETSDYLKATCGNINKPCKLNINIKKWNILNLSTELERKMNLLKNIKNNITMTKLNFLFNFIEEDKAIELFEKQKNDLNLLQENFNNLFSLYYYVVDNKDKNNIINDKLLEQFEYIKEYKEYINLYLNNNNTNFDKNKYLKNAFEIYTTKLKNIDKTIRENRYIENILDKNTKYNINTLIQNKYTLKNMEIIYHLEKLKLK